MQNPITPSPVKLIPQIKAALPGVTKYATALALPADFESKMTARLAALLSADSDYEQARIALRECRATLAKCIKSGGNHARAVRELVKPDLTPTYSQGWDAFGFVGSLQVPKRADELLMMLTKMGSHLAAHPALGEAEPKLVAAKTVALLTALIAANTAVQQKKAALQRALEVRTDKADDVRQILRELLGTLRFRLTPLDHRWVEFGFKKPGAKAIPDVPTEVTAEVIGDKVLAVKWPAVPRAEHYRLWERGPEADVEWVPLGTTVELNFLLEEWSQDAGRELALSAVNDGGESGKGVVGMKLPVGG